MNVPAQPKRVSPSDQTPGDPISKIQRVQPPSDDTAATPPDFPWRWENTWIAGRERPMAVASDPDGMLLDACRRQDEGEEGVIDPFWATTWRAASGLDRFLEQVPLKGVDVLEVGCGTGHAGISAAYRGANVVLTDGVADPLVLVRMTLQRLRLEAEVGVLRLGQDSLVGRRFPLILGSDVTYLRTLWPELLRTAAEHLTPDGVLLLSDPRRVIANEFRQWVRDKPWSYTEHQVQLPDDPDHPIRVMQLSK